MSSSVGFQNGLRAALKADAAVAAIYGDRIYDHAPNIVTYPYISLGPSDFSLEDIGDDCGVLCTETFQVDGWHRGGGALWPARNGAKAVGRALHDAEISVPGYPSHRVQLALARVFNGQEEGTERVVIQITVRIED